MKVSKNKDKISSSAAVHAASKSCKTGCIELVHENSVCFLCYDGGTLVMCDRRKCLKAYHPQCVGRNMAFFKTKGAWLCARHFCSKCSKQPSSYCIMCPISYCLRCLSCLSKEDYLPLSKEAGLCDICMRLVRMIEYNQIVDENGTVIDFDDTETVEYLFKGYWLLQKKIHGYNIMGTKYLETSPLGKTSDHVVTKVVSSMSTDILGAEKRDAAVTSEGQNDQPRKRVLIKRRNDSTGSIVTVKKKIRVLKLDPSSDDEEQLVGKPSTNIIRAGIQAADFAKTSSKDTLNAAEPSTTHACSEPLPATNISYPLPFKTTIFDDALPDCSEPPTAQLLLDVIEDFPADVDIQAAALSPDNRSEGKNIHSPSSSNRQSPIELVKKTILPAQVSLGFNSVTLPKTPVRVSACKVKPSPVKLLTNSAAKASPKPNGSFKQNIEAKHSSPLSAKESPNKPTHCKPLLTNSKPTCNTLTNKRLQASPINSTEKPFISCSTTCKPRDTKPNNMLPAKQQHDDDDTPCSVTKKVEQASSNSERAPSPSSKNQDEDVANDVLNAPCMFPCSINTVQAPLNMQNVASIFLRRSELEELHWDQRFANLVLGAFVRIRNGRHGNNYRLVQIIGTSLQDQYYCLGVRRTNFVLEVMNLNKRRRITLDYASNNMFTEEECQLLQQTVELGFINAPTMRALEDKAASFQRAKRNEILSKQGTDASLQDCNFIKADADQRSEISEELAGANYDEGGKRIHKSDDGSHLGNKTITDLRCNLDDQRFQISTKLITKTTGLMTHREDKEGSRFINEATMPFIVQEQHIQKDTNPAHSSYFLANSQINPNTESMHKVVNSAQINVKREGPEVNAEKKDAMEYNMQATQILPVREEEKGQSIEAAVALPKAEQEQKNPDHMHLTQQPEFDQQAGASCQWHYQDLKGKMYGPFSMAQLSKWSKTGVFPPDIQVWKMNAGPQSSIPLKDALQQQEMKFSIEPANEKHATMEDCLDVGRGREDTATVDIVGTTEASLCEKQLRILVPKEIDSPCAPAEPLACGPAMAIRDWDSHPVSTKPTIMYQMRDHDSDMAWSPLVSLHLNALKKQNDFVYRQDNEKVSSWRDGFGTNSGQKAMLPPSHKGERYPQSVWNVIPEATDAAKQSMADMMDTGYNCGPPWKGGTQIPLTVQNGWTSSSAAVVDDGWTSAAVGESGLLWTCAEPKMATKNEHIIKRSENDMVNDPENPLIDKDGAPKLHKGWHQQEIENGTFDDDGWVLPEAGESECGRDWSSVNCTWSGKLEGYMEEGQRRAKTKNDGRTHGSSHAKGSGICHKLPSDWRREPMQSRWQGTSISPQYKAFQLQTSRARREREYSRSCSKEPYTWTDAFRSQTTKGRRERENDRLHSRQSCTEREKSGFSRSHSREPYSCYQEKKTLSHLIHDERNRSPSRQRDKERNRFSSNQTHLTVHNAEVGESGLLRTSVEPRLMGTKDDHINRSQDDKVNDPGNPTIGKNGTPRLHRGGHEQGLENKTFDEDGWDLPETGESEWGRDWNSLSSTQSGNIKGCMEKGQGCSDVNKTREDRRSHDSSYKGADSCHETPRFTPGWKRAQMQSRWRERSASSEHKTFRLGNSRERRPRDYRRSHSREPHTRMDAYRSLTSKERTAREKGRFHFREPCARRERGFSRSHSREPSLCYQEKKTWGHHKRDVQNRSPSSHRNRNAFRRNHIPHPRDYKVSPDSAGKGGFERDVRDDWIYTSEEHREPKDATLSSHGPFPKTYEND